jgi:hypothetical protein
LLGRIESQKRVPKITGVGEVSSSLSLGHMSSLCRPCKLERARLGAADHCGGVVKVEAALLKEAGGLPPHRISNRSKTGAPDGYQHPQITFAARCDRLMMAENIIIRLRSLSTRDSSILQLLKPSRIV